MKIIKLSKNFETIVDDEDHEWLNQLSWHIRIKNNQICAMHSQINNGKVKKIRMHRLIVKAEVGDIVVHKNGNCLDNRKENLHLIIKEKRTIDSNENEELKQNGIILLTKGYRAVVDIEDYDNINQYVWCVSNDTTHKKVYARRVENKKYILMHRVILNASEGMVVDHINGDTLDNKRSNLRIVTYRENSINNLTPYGDAHFNKSFNGKQWTARVRNGKKCVYLGLYYTKEEAQTVAMQYRIDNNILKHPNNPIEKQRLEEKL